MNPNKSQEAQLSDTDDGPWGKRYQETAPPFRGDKPIEELAEFTGQVDKISEDSEKITEVVLSQDEHGNQPGLEERDDSQEKMEAWQKTEEATKQIQEQMIDELKTYFVANHNKESEERSGSLPNLVSGVEGIIDESLTEATSSDDFIQKIIGKMSAGEKKEIKDRIKTMAKGNLATFNPDSFEHKAKVQAEIKACKERFKVHESKELHNKNIENLNLNSLSYDELEKICFHYSAKNNGNSIDENGIRSGIGDNSAGIDENEAIYFSYGIEGALHTWDVWLKWRLGRLYAPDMQGSPTIESQQEAEEYFEYREKWNNEVVSGDYKHDQEKLNALFEYQKAELTGSDYYALDLAEGSDFSFDTIDPKKARVRGNPYEEIKFGNGISTDLSHDRMEKWNMFTPLGERKELSPDRIKRLVLNDGSNDVNSVLTFLYDKYQEHCKDIGEVPTDFDLLDRYMVWNKGNSENV